MVYLLLFSGILTLDAFTVLREQNSEVLPRKLHIGRDVLESQMLQLQVFQ